MCYLRVASGRGNGDEGSRPWEKSDRPRFLEEAKPAQPQRDNQRLRARVIPRSVWKSKTGRQCYNYKHRVIHNKDPFHRLSFQNPP